MRLQPPVACAPPQPCRVLTSRAFPVTVAGAKERTHWDQYMAAHEDMLNHTSTEWAHWCIIPADCKWFTRLAVSESLVRRLKALDLALPVVSEERRQELDETRAAPEQAG